MHIRSGFIWIVVLFFLWMPMKAYSQIQGKLRLDNYTFDPSKADGNLDLSISTTIWYRGDQSIQEVPHLSIQTDSMGTRTSTYIKYYLFIDPDLQEYIYYKNFSDTSKVVMRYHNENPFEKHSGWNMYSNTEFNYDNSIKLSDTILNGEKHSRFLFNHVKNWEENKFILYTICNKKEVPIRYSKTFSDQIGYPVVRMDTYFKNRLVGITQLHYVSDSLTNNEINVFRAWHMDLNSKQQKSHVRRKKS